MYHLKLNTIIFFIIGITGAQFRFKFFKVKKKKQNSPQTHLGELHWFNITSDAGLHTFVLLLRRPHT